MVKEFDVVVYGVMGFMGWLVVEYLIGNVCGVKWVMVGCSVNKFVEVCDLIGVFVDMLLIVVDVFDEVLLVVMCVWMQVVLMMVGFYQFYGNELVVVCVVAGIDYVDLCGEFVWMWYKIDVYVDVVRVSGVWIVFSCGFDLILFDFGVLMVQDCVRVWFGEFVLCVKGCVWKMVGMFFGGIVVSLKVMFVVVVCDLGIVRLLISLFVLIFGFSGLYQLIGMIFEYDVIIEVWVVLFVMVLINIKNVYCINFLFGQVYGVNFVYDEMMVVGFGDFGKIVVEVIVKFNLFVGDKGLKFGDGFFKVECDVGYYDLLFVGLMFDGMWIDVVVIGDCDLGYGLISKMIVEVVLCLVWDVEGDGGIWMLGVLMGL